MGSTISPKCYNQAHKEKRRRRRCCPAVNWAAPLEIEAGVGGAGMATRGCGPHPALDQIAHQALTFQPGDA